jgi:hypothetical protein
MRMSSTTGNCYYANNKLGATRRGGRAVILPGLRYPVLVNTENPYMDRK